MATKSGREGKLERASLHTGGGPRSNKHSGE